MFKLALPEDRQMDTTIESPCTQWPVESQQIVLRTEDGEPPKVAKAVGVGEWQRVWRLRDVENLYDLGFWGNVKDVFWPRSGFYVQPAHVEQVSTTATEGDSDPVGEDGTAD